MTNVQIDALPQTIDEFITLRNNIAQTPFGGAAMMVLALLAYAQNKELGRQCLTATVDRGRLIEGDDGYKGWQLNRADMRRIQDRIKPYMPRSYIQGAAPENGYQLLPPPYIIKCSDNPYSGDIEAGAYKVFVACSGAATPRPVSLKRNNRGYWKADNWSSLTVGMVAPVHHTDDDL